jgi:hypothetical protein
MRVFVLSTGRSGTVTFSKACSRLTNFSSGHETNARRYGDARFEYPENHIEVDSRLSWFLGELLRRFPDAYYVHLKRDEEATAQSIARKWHGGAISFSRAFGESMVMLGGRAEQRMRLDLARFQVRTVNANIELMLSAGVIGDSMTMQLENWKKDFPKFLTAIKAQGPLDAALREFRRRHNASPRRTKCS